jgi:hypothetical protein
MSNQNTVLLHEQARLRPILLLHIASQNPARNISVREIRICKIPETTAQTVPVPHLQIMSEDMETGITRVLILRHPITAGVHI